MSTASPGTDQHETIAFLRDPASYPAGPRTVEVIETHAALVFLAGDEAIKIKRAISVPYLDFSTLEKRAAACRREMEINAPHAPEIYRALVSITRGAGGRLGFDGDGPVVEWGVRMARFSQDDVLSNIAETRGIDETLARGLATMLSDAHAKAPVIGTEHESVAGFTSILANVEASLTSAAERDPSLATTVSDFVERAGRALARITPLLVDRQRGGLVRRCHGDLHLGNIVLWHGCPTLFDALEFDETLASIDLLYDLAFLLMDLDRRGQSRAANIVLNRYLSATARDLDLDGLAALPLFLATRAAIRAMVAFDRGQLQDDATRHATETHARETLALAVRYLHPAAPCLVAVGGLSGTGKTTVAANLAPHIAPAPGALHIRSDVERKRLAGLDALQPLAPESYTPEASARTYAWVAARARRALTAGHSVIVDAVFARPDERRRMEAVAREAGVRFAGIWLDAPADLLKARVAARRGDASDATPAVVERQIATGVGDVDWRRIDADGSPETVLARARQTLAPGADPGTG